MNEEVVGGIIGLIVGIPLFLGCMCLGEYLADKFIGDFYNRKWGLIAVSPSLLLVTVLVVIIVFLGG